MTRIKYRGELVDWDHDLPMDQFDECEWASAASAGAGRPAPP